MRKFHTSPTEMIGGLWRNRELIRALAINEVLGRYRGSIVGIFWSFLNPIFMLAVYTFVFSEIFKARWSEGESSKVEFALVLFSGLIVFNLFAECINRAPNLIVSNVNYVKKVIFPLEILPFVALVASGFHGLISLIVWLLSYIIFFGLPHMTMLWLPLIIIPFLFLIMGLSWMLASLGVYLRDTSQIVSIFITTLMFLSPIFYPLAALPESYRNLLYLNPMTLIIEQVRGVIFWNKSPDFLNLGIYLVVAIIIAWLGFYFFQKSRKGFSDVI